MADIDITPESAGWHYTGLRTATVTTTRRFTTADDEALVLPLSGSVTVTVGAESHHLRGRPDVFAGPTDFAYIPRRTTATLTAEAPCRVAVPTARTTTDLPFRYVPGESVPIEQRGAGQAARTVRNLCTQDSFPADRLLVVEVITPGGNWSSWPPHKHDEEIPGRETPKEEIYYYEGGPAYQRVYSSPAGEIDVLREVRTGDTVLVPHGYHGPTTTLPSHPLYYLNVLAGPAQGPTRSMSFTDDPTYAWIRETWTTAPSE